MQTRPLTEAEFKAAFKQPMRNVTQTTNVLDIWPYVHAVSPDDLHGHRVRDGFVEYVYRDGGGRYDHVLVMTHTKNVYLTVVVDLAADQIHGHRLLDLNKEYGI